MGKNKFGLSSLLRRGAAAASSSSSSKLSTQKRKQKQDDRVATMISEQTRWYFRCVLFVFFGSAVVLSGYAPNKGPNLPTDFCPHGDITATTGECMCHWQHKVRVIVVVVVVSATSRVDNEGKTKR